MENNQPTKTKRPRIEKGQVVASTNATTFQLLNLCKELGKEVIEYYNPFTREVRRKIKVITI
jgi:hypothetical protein